VSSHHPDGLAAVPAEALLAELERRAANGHPVLAQCPDCTRSDAIVCVQCGDHGDHGVFMFPLRPRAIATLDRQLAPLLVSADIHGIDLWDLPCVQRKTRESSS
jgi:hypothetical protein